LLQNSDINNYGIDDFDITPIDPLEEQYKSGYNGLEDLKTLGPERFPFPEKYIQ
jgi:hypothetical protein